MKRIIALLLIIFMSSLILNGFFAAIHSEKKYHYKYSNIDTLSIKEDTLNLKLDTINLKKTKKYSLSKKEHTATWYSTHRHKKVHRNHPTAAYNLVPKGTWLIVRNIKTGDSCVVEVTDRHKMGKNHIDLSYKAFGILSKHSHGRIKVILEEL